MFDVIITGGTVVDGLGSPGYRADLGVTGETIEAINDPSRSEARRVIDATNMTVSPGFIDPHTHSEGALLVDPQHANGLRQGITTEILGLDGMSHAPLSTDNYRIYRRWLGGVLGDPPDDLDMSSVASFRANYHKKVAINTAYLVPNGTVRLEVLGFYDLPLVGNALEKARRLVREGIEQGTVGMSSGGAYYPGIWADTTELVELCKTVHQAGGVYMAEARRIHGDRAYSGGGIPEALEIARRSGARLHLAHTRTGSDTAGGVAKLMEPVDQAEAEGVDCTLDIYPYAEGSSIAVSLPPSYAQEGGPDGLIRRLKDPSERRRITDYLNQDHDTVGRLDRMVFSYLPKNAHLEGMSVADIARERGATLPETLCEFLLDEELKVGYLAAPPQSRALRRQVSRDSMELLARHDYMVCSDITPPGSMLHPRSYGAFPRFLGRLRREFGGLSLEQMVHRMTERTALRFGLTKRGRIEKGYYADLVVFDAERVIDNATYDDPRQFPAGIPFVLVFNPIRSGRDRGDATWP